VVWHHVLIAGVVAGVDEPVTGKGMACGGCEVVVVFAEEMVASMQEHTVTAGTSMFSMCGLLH
jgi:hypothetical protein